MGQTQKSEKEDEPPSLSFGSSQPYSQPCYKTAVENRDNYSAARHAVQSSACCRKAGGRLGSSRVSSSATTGKAWHTNVSTASGKKKTSSTSTALHSTNRRYDVCIASTQQQAQEPIQHTASPSVRARPCTAHPPYTVSTKPSIMRTLHHLNTTTAVTSSAHTS